MKCDNVKPHIYEIIPIWVITITQTGGFLKVSFSSLERGVKEKMNVTGIGWMSEK